MSCVEIKDKIKMTMDSTVLSDENQENLQHYQAMYDGLCAQERCVKTFFITQESKLLGGCNRNVPDDVYGDDELLAPSCFVACNDLHDEAFKHG